jgi:serine/threonine-protein kinase
VSDAEDRARKRVGAVLNDKWTLEQLLGVGGMAAVYSAKHRNGARAAIKILHPSLASVDEIRDRFLREGYAANRTEHEGAVQVLDDDVIQGEPEDGAPYLVMELLEGESLLARMKRGLPMPEKEALQIMDAVLDVLISAHARGVVHRDLKPENLFLPKTGNPLVKIVDFGLARLTDRQGQTVHGMAIGTPSYMSPEQAAGRVDQIDARTDLFALGATAFELLAGRTVHGKGDVLEIVMKVAKEQAPAIRSVAPDVHEATAKVIDRVLQFEREARYPNATEMRADVKKALEALDVGTRATMPAPSEKDPPPVPSQPQRASRPSRPSDPEPVTPSPAAPPSARNVEPAPPKPARRSLLPLLAALAYIGIAVAVIFERSGASSTPHADADAAPAGSTTLDEDAQPLGTDAASVPVVDLDDAGFSDAAEDDDADLEEDLDAETDALPTAEIDAGKKPVTKPPGKPPIKRPPIRRRR